LHRALFFCLSVGSALGGNGSLIGTSANLVTAGIAERAGYPITYLYFLKLRFQALQAMIYQIVGLAIQLVLGLLWGLCGFGFFFLMMFGTMLSVALIEEPSSVPIPLFLNMFSPVGVFCLMIPYLLIWLGFIAYGLYGAYQVYLGRDFRYALIGARVEAYLAQL